ncbi:MAG: 4-hydroxy-tetrahydrodipicolinate synthase [Pseudomonadota bacterium]|nr:4-hydroxy-tetrahydrodipicolinate synthase [Pseudomonadota bacterium]
MMRLPKTFLKGSIPPLITPFKNGSIDYDAYAGLVEFQVKNGSHGILVNGTTSEPSTLTTEERNRTVDVAIEAAGGKVPIVAATGSQSLAETAVLTEHADKAGADALLIVTPYYIRPPQSGLIAYYSDLGKRTKLPWMIYHIPGRAAVSVTLSTLDQISRNCPNFVGMKHAVDDLGFVSKCIDHFGKDFRIFVGLEDLSYPMMTVGACGLMNAVGNLMPRQLARMCEQVWKGNMKAAQKIHYDLFEINQAVFFDTNPTPMKYMMKKLGIMPKNEHRLPMMPASKELEKRLDGVLKRAGLLDKKPKKKAA